jgi:hypothetical protein
MTEEGFTPLFNGTDLAGWTAIPRNYGTMWPGGPPVTDVLTDLPPDYNERADQHPAEWTVEEGVIVGRQSPRGSGWGGYLISDRAYGDFELRLEAKPDWPADTGIMLRRRRDSWAGIQVLIDHRQSGSIGGFYGNGIGAFHAVPFALDAVRDAAGKAIGLEKDNPETSVEPYSIEKSAMLDYACDVDDFLATWRWDDWNEFRVRCEGDRPTVTVWINDLKISQISLATLQSPNYDADAIAALLGPSGHIALEVHDNDPVLKDDRWAPDAACRWRNIRIREA